MKKIFGLVVALVLTGSLFANGTKDAASPAKWPSGPVTVICPWAVGGVADLVNRKTAVYGEELLGKPVLATNVLGAGGNVALTNYLKEKPNSLNLIFGAEGAFSIAPNVTGGQAIQFKYDDFIPVVNLYSSIFVLTASSKLGINSLDSLKAYGADKKIKIAVNGMAGSEAFLAKALFKELGLQIDLVSYNGANLALDAAAKGETQFAVSHQSQAKGSVEAGILTPVVAFDKTGLTNGVFKGVKGVGEYGYKMYFRNRCFILVRKGTSPEVVNRIRNVYLEILKKPEIIDFYKTMMIEIDPMDTDSMNAHITSVTDIVKALK